MGSSTSHSMRAPLAASGLVAFSKEIVLNALSKTTASLGVAGFPAGALMNLVLYRKGWFKSCSLALRKPAREAGGRISSPKGASAEIRVETASNSPRKLAAGKKRSGGAPVSEDQTPSRAGTLLARACRGGGARESSGIVAAAALRRSARLRVEKEVEVEEVVDEEGASSS